MEPILVLQHVTKQYGKNLSILKDINYTFQKGTFYGVIGASGAGKTTLLQLLGTLDEVTSGELYIKNRPVHNLNSKEKAQLRNQHIGFVFQSYFLNSKLTAVENVMLPMLITERSFALCQQKATELLVQLGLELRLTHLPSQLSGGEQQRVAIARALANDPDILLADEPTGNLDEETEQSIMQLFCDLVQNTGKTIIMVTHNRSLLHAVDQVLLLEEGCLKQL